MKDGQDIFKNIDDLFFNTFGETIAEQLPSPVKYPINFPRTIGEIQCRTPQELHEEMNEFVVKWGFTKFEFNGDKITIHNDKFKEAKTQTSNRICDTYNNKNHKNFD